MLIILQALSLQSLLQHIKLQQVAIRHWVSIPILQKIASNVPTMRRVFHSPMNSVQKQNAQCWKYTASALIGKRPVTQQVSIDKRSPTGGLSGISHRPI